MDTVGNASAGHTLALYLPADPMDVVLISTAAELAAIDDDLESLNDYYILTADIDLAGVEWDPIGNDSDANDGLAEEPFVGIFDGGGHTIHNLTIDSTINGNIQTEHIGLFEYIGASEGSDAVVRNLHLEGVTVIATSYDLYLRDTAGTLCAWNFGLIENCYATGTISGETDVGGLVGGLVDSNINRIATVSDCYSISTVGGICNVGGLVGGMGTPSNTATVTGCYASGSALGVQRTGGLIGSSTSGVVSESYADGVVFRIGTYVGGLIGESVGTVVSRCYSNVTFDGGHASQMGGLIGANDGPVSDSFSLGPVNNFDDQAGNEVGGLVGSNEPAGSISRCYSIGGVVGNADLGGLVGVNTGAISDSFYDQTTSGMSATGKGTPKPTAEMKNVATFTWIDTGNVGLDNPWDFVGTPNDDSGTNDYWNINGGINDGYPYLTGFE